ncbi:MAG: hypothetical protein ACKN9U_14060, partial [Pirellulaceae bacterium]
MHRWMQRAAGGTIQRLNSSPATIRSRSSNDHIHHPLYVPVGSILAAVRDRLFAITRPLSFST